MRKLTAGRIDEIIDEKLDSKLIPGIQQQAMSPSQGEGRLVEGVRKFNAQLKGAGFPRVPRI